MSELSPDAFHQQAHEYDAVPDVREGLLKLLQLEGATHPFAVVRFAELDRWAGSGDYARILAGNYPRREDDSTASVGEEVKSAAAGVPGVVEPFRGPVHRLGAGRRRDGGAQRAKGSSAGSSAAAATATTTTAELYISRRTESGQPRLPAEPPRGGQVVS